jgi:erythrocyte membrane protein band 4.1
VAFCTCLQRKSKGQDLLDKVCEHLNLLEKDYFGLTYEDRHDPHIWLEMDKRIAKFVKSKFVLELLTMNKLIFNY